MEKNLEFTVNGLKLTNVGTIVKDNVSICVCDVTSYTSEVFVIELKLGFGDSKNARLLFIPFYNDFCDCFDKSPIEIVMGFAESLIDLAPQHFEDTDALREFADSFFDKFLVDSLGFISKIWADEDEEEKRQLRERMIDEVVDELKCNYSRRLEWYLEGYFSDYDKLVARICDWTCVKKSEYRDYIIEKIKERL